MPSLFDLREGAVSDVDLGRVLDVDAAADLVAHRPDLSGHDGVRLHMESFKDGRAFTQARLLRQRYGFEGRVIVSGPVLPDQAQALLRVGADLVEMERPERAADFARAVRAYRYAYQRPGAQDPAFELRGSGR
jgi:uncharacterized protein (DUF934 family)